MTTAQEHAERIARALEAWAEPETWTQAGLETTDLHWMREVRNSDDYGIVWCGAFPAESAHKIAAHIAAANPAALTALLSERTELLARVGELEGALNGLVERDITYMSNDVERGVFTWDDIWSARAALKGHP